MIAVKNLCIERGGKQLFSNFDLNIAKGEILAIKGESGRGKSTLLGFLSNLPLDDAKVSFDEKKIDGKISYLFQESRLIENLTVKKNVILPLLNIYEKKEAESIAEKYIKIVRLEDKKNQRCAKLSGGEKQRVALARAFAFKSEIIFLDEAFNSLDAATKRRIMADFKEILKSEKRTVVFVSHEENEIEDFCTRVLEL